MSRTRSGLARRVRARSPPSREPATAEGRGPWSAKRAVGGAPSRRGARPPRPPPGIGGPWRKGGWISGAGAQTAGDRVGFRGWRSAAGEAKPRAAPSARAGVLRRCHKNVLCDAPERGEEPPHRKPRPAGRGCVGGVPADRTHNAPYGRGGLGLSRGRDRRREPRARSDVRRHRGKRLMAGAGRRRLARSPARQARSSSYGFGVEGSASTAGPPSPSSKSKRRVDPFSSKVSCIPSCRLSNSRVFCRVICHLADST